MKCVILIDDDGIIEEDDGCGDYYFIEDVTFIVKKKSKDKIPKEIDSNIGK